MIAQTEGLAMADLTTRQTLSHLGFPLRRSYLHYNLHHPHLLALPIGPSPEVAIGFALWVRRVVVGPQ